MAEEKILPKNRTYRAWQYKGPEEFEDLKAWVFNHNKDRLILLDDGRVLWAQVALTAEVGYWFVLTPNGLVLFDDKRFNELYKKKE